MTAGRHIESLCLTVVGPRSAQLGTGCRISHIHWEDAAVNAWYFPSSNVPTVFRYRKIENKSPLVIEW